MPKCRSCSAPIIFLTTEPTFRDPNPRSVPVDINPDNARGTIAIYESPSRFSAYPPHRDATNRRNYIRFQYHEAAKMYLQAGGALYTNHFDTCSARNRPRRIDSGPEKPDS